VSCIVWFIPSDCENAETRVNMDDKVNAVVRNVIDSKIFHIDKIFHRIEYILNLNIFCCFLSLLVEDNEVDLR